MLKIDINKNKKEAIQKAIDVLKDGGLIVYPTETCYGVGCDATNDKALQKLLQYKKFRGSKPISIAVSDRNMVEEYVDINEMADNIYRNFLPGPITVISIGKGNLKAPVVSASGGVGVRYPDYQFTLDLIKEFGKPITATSANMSYRSAPYDIEKLIDNLPKKSLELIDIFLDAGQLSHNEPSTVLDTTLNELSILRQGKLQFEDALVRNRKVGDIISKNTEETIKYGSDFAKRYLKEQPVLVALSGELGAGKTQFTKGIAKELGVTETVNSPTYTIINEYEYGNRVLAHMDTWRLEKIAGSGLVEHLEKGDIVVVEWADKFFGEISALCDNMNVKMYKVVIKYISLTERSIEIYEG
ncbi:MAG: L-threonylcarbamoyladenylate synthase [Candidatus Dojkabacteria bacterium]|nr:L-threonylcarbamoyladenylate synthase [Candidatus Dojkabacteria bacterium]